ncbi:hypothetical protein JCM3766R1_004788 [Sporobolomyces carnicolor]
MPASNQNKLAKDANDSKDDSPRAAAAIAKSSNKVKRAHPSYQDMILQAIEEDGDKGLASRQVIKKYLLHRYGLNDTHQFDVQVSAAIRRGRDNGTFLLPKGFSGKIKVATPASQQHKENAAPNAKKGPRASKRVSAVTSKKTALAQSNKHNKSSASASTALKPKKRPAATATKPKSTPAAVTKDKKTDKKKENKPVRGGKVSPPAQVPAAKKAKKTTGATGIKKTTRAKEPSAARAKKATAAKK